MKLSDFIEAKRKGFTMLEILLVLGVFSILLVLSLPAIRSFGKTSDVVNAKDEIVSVLRIAHSKTVASEGDARYGVYFNDTTDPHQYVLFQGDSYASRVVTLDEVHELEDSVDFSSISFGGGKEIVFDRIVGTTSQFGSTVLEYKSDSTKTETIYVEGSGNIEVGTSTAGTDTDRVKDSRHVHVDYEGRTIDVSSGSSETMTLDFSPSVTTEDILLFDYISGGIFNWEGNITVDGEVQVLKIHTHKLNVSFETQFSFHRDARYNTKPMEVTLSGDLSGHVVKYDTASTITLTGKSTYASTVSQQ